MGVSVGARECWSGWMWVGVGVCEWVRMGGCGFEWVGVGVNVSG